VRFVWTDVVVVVVVVAAVEVVVVLVKGRGNGHGESGHAARGIAVLMYVCMYADFSFAHLSLL
jgi:preprotein translocase subunit SecG